MPADKHLTCEVVDDELQIRIGIDTLGFATDRSELFNPFDEDRNDFVQRWKVIDNKGWAEEIADELNREDEIGGSPLIYLIEKMFQKALDQGSLSVWDSENDE